MGVVFDFIKNNPVCDILVMLGILAMIITYVLAPRASKKSGRYVSGIPTIGGILIALGFLISSVKWLAVIGIFEPGILYLIFKVMPEYFRFKSEIKKWVPPVEYEGGRVLEYTKYGKKLEEVKELFDEGRAGWRIHEIIRYIIIEKDGHFELLGQEISMDIAVRNEYLSVEECKKAASEKAKWKKRL